VLLNAADVPESPAARVVAPVTPSEPVTVALFVTPRLPRVAAPVTPNVVLELRPVAVMAPAAKFPLASRSTNVLTVLSGVPVALVPAVP